MTFAVTGQKTAKVVAEVFPNWDASWQGGYLNVMMTQNCLLWGISSALTHSILWTLMVCSNSVYLNACVLVDGAISPNEITICKSSSTTFTS